MAAEGIRLNKYLAECGVCSRRDADRLIDDADDSFPSCVCRRCCTGVQKRIGA